MNGWVGICRHDFIGDSGSMIIFYDCADVLAVFNFQIDIFSNDRIIAVANNKKLRLCG